MEEEIGAPQERALRSKHKMRIFIGSIVIVCIFVITLFLVKTKFIENISSPESVSLNAAAAHSESLDPIQSSSHKSPPVESPSAQSETTESHNKVEQNTSKPDQKDSLRKKVRSPSDEIFVSADIEDPEMSSPIKSAVAGFINESLKIARSERPKNAGKSTPAPLQTDALAKVAYGAALGELQAQTEEFAVNGWQQIGTVTVSGSPEVTTRTQKNVKQIVVKLCLDSSNLEIRDDAKNLVLTKVQPGKRTNLNIYVLQEVSDTWLVVEHTFPGSTNC